jgi:ribosomal protein S18 acetylase RimI-like enzyme
VKSDLTITYRENEKPGKDDFFRLYLSTGWNEEYKLTADEIFECMTASWYMVSAYDGQQLVGFGRILSDGKLHALITEMIVLPEYQGNGIGRQILKMITEVCFKHEIRDIQLFSARGKAGFYEKFGYKRRPEKGPGMEIKNMPK